MKSRNEEANVVPYNPYTGNAKGAAPEWYIERDGSEFINIYSQGTTKLGRELSHFHKSPFTHPFFGHFDSMEGFWYYMRSNVRDDKLRYLSGFEAKVKGRVLPASWYPHFWEDVLAANYQKVIQNPSLMQMLADSVLPFTHYYVFKGRGGNIVIHPRDWDVLSKGMSDIREAIIHNRPTVEWENAEKRYVNSITDKGTLASN
jgi:hypothetical protein